MRNGNLLKSCVSKICVKRIRFNQGVGVQLVWYSSLTISVEDFRVGSKWACSASQESDLSSKTFLPSVSQPSSQPSFSALPSVFSFVMSLDTFSSIHQPDRILITFSWQAKSSSYYSGKCPFSKKLSYWSKLYASMPTVAKFHGTESTGVNRSHLHCFTSYVKEQ